MAAVGQELEAASEVADWGRSVVQVGKTPQERDLGDEVRAYGSWQDNGGEHRCVRRCYRG